MAFQFSTAARNAALDAIETAIGTAPTLTLRTGADPADCAAADSGTVLATLALPSDWMAAASAGAKALAGSWQDVAADAAGVAAHFRIKQGATCHLQGTEAFQAQRDLVPAFPPERFHTDTRGGPPSESASRPERPQWPALA